MKTVAAFVILAAVLAGCASAQAPAGSLRVATGVDEKGNVIYRNVYAGPHSDAQTPQTLCSGCTI